jgi:hypothetical protein
MAESPGTFSIAALYDALDSQRAARGLTWTQAVREINAQFQQSGARPLGAATVTGMRNRTAVEADGVLQMLLWLNRSPESFIKGHVNSSAKSLALPAVGPDKILRFDARMMFAAIEARRAARHMTSKQIADEIGGAMSPGSLQRLANGGRLAFPHVMRITAWLERPAASFTRACDR